MFFFDYVKRFLIFIVLGLTALCFIQALIIPTTMGVLVLVVLIIILVAIALDNDHFCRRR